MASMRYDRIDPERLLALVADARRRDDFSSPELGSFVANLCKMVLCSGCFRGYTEDWQADMFGDACLAVFSGMRTADLERRGGKFFNYFYTIATNACKRSLKRRVRDTVPLDEFSQARAVEPFHIRNRRRLLRGLVEANEGRIVRLAAARRMARLENVVGKAAEIVSGRMDSGEIDELTELSRKIREERA